MSDADDYERPHTVHAATEDVLDLVQAVCSEPDCTQPSVIVGFGKLGSAVAQCYLSATSQIGGSLTNATHSEVSGEGSVQPPVLLLCLPNEKGSIDDLDDTNTYIYDADIAKALIKSADSCNTDVLVPAHNSGSYSANCRVEECVDAESAVNMMISFLK